MNASTKQQNNSEENNWRLNEMIPKITNAGNIQKKRIWNSSVNKVQSDILPMLKKNLYPNFILLPI